MPAEGDREHGAGGPSVIEGGTVLGLQLWATSEECSHGSLPDWVEPALSRANCLCFPNTVVCTLELWAKRNYPFALSGYFIIAKGKATNAQDYQKAKTRQIQSCRNTNHLNQLL